MGSCSYVFWNECKCIPPVIVKLLHSYEPMSETIVVVFDFFPTIEVHKFAYKMEWFSGFSKFSFSNKIENQAERSLKSLCDKSVKKKNVIRPNSSSVRDDRCGIWLFSRRHYSRSINLLTRRNDFQDFQNFHFLTKSKIKPSDRLQDGEIFIDQQNTDICCDRKWSPAIICNNSP